ncbi:hypothetical protein ACQJBY_052453 [Aegilops geniculata]
MKSSPPPPPMPAASGDLRRRAARPKLPTVRASLPSIQTLCSRPLQPARNHTPMARVSGMASPARLRRPKLGHAMGVPHPPRSPPSRNSSRRCQGRHGHAAHQDQLRNQSHDG